MKPRFLFSLTRVVVSVLFYFFVLVGIYLLASEIINLVSGQKIQAGSNLYDSEVISFNSRHQPDQVFSWSHSEQSRLYVSFTALHQPDQASVCSRDGRTAYVPTDNHYAVSAAPASPLGYFTFGFKLGFVILILLVFWNLKRIFRELNLAELFRSSVVKRLKIIALVFFAYDLLKGLHYLVFSHFMDIAFPEAHLRLVTTIGRGFFVALILWVIAVVYQRGLSFQEENALTI